jgi:hypothetical protein
MFAFCGIWGSNEHFKVVVICTQVSKQPILSHMSDIKNGRGGGGGLHLQLEKPTLEGDSSLDCNNDNALSSFSSP